MDFPISKDQLHKHFHFKHQNTGVGGPALYPGLETVDIKEYEKLFNPETGIPLRCAREDGIFGPCIMFKNINLAEIKWEGSCLIVAPSTIEKPALYIQDGNNPPEPLAGYLLDTFYKSSFWRFDISIPLDYQNEKKVTYRINNVGPQYNFTVPAQKSEIRWCFWSCNGWSLSVKEEEKQKLGGDNAVWNDLLDKHNRFPFHLMVGGGDQLYSDVLWSLRVLQPWLGIKSKTERRDAPFTEEMTRQIDTFYFMHYIKMFFFHNRLGDAMTTIPYSFIVDDHDIFDGWGSYPDYLHESKVFQGIKQFAFKYWLLFQAQTTQQLSREHGYFGGSGFSWLKSLGPYTSILGVDTRYERNIQRIVTREAYDEIFWRLNNQVSPHCRHLLVFLGVPIVYPRLNLIEAGFSMFKTTKLYKLPLFQKDGAFSNILNQFGEPELMDDLNDHWTADVHMEERKDFIIRLQELARTKNIRVTFVAGDVHCCGAGRLASQNPEIKDVQHDPRYMVQIISSAIVNIPPPNAVIRGVHYSAKLYNLNSSTNEKMFKLFKEDVNGKSPPNNNTKLLARRNFSTFVENHESGAVMVNIHVQREDAKGTVPYNIAIPKLLASNVV
ncbi:hypothetical protein H4219_002438 [Mycoemilia scoparia]|uniref:PhoD-like phosphatase domain-containing protein n=1 Tax=Mycoemilia scoparia TaxID=417184 RepID=A0A9W8A177_9FUNG|nr:hypothetical protein H4219_002438 [Mycoemilia scoparia]